MVFDLESALLRSWGHQVERATVSNKSLPASFLRKGIEVIWSHPSYKKVRDVLRDKDFDVVHFHNTFARLSPSVYWAAASERVPVVQTLHNYRLTCANAMLMREDSFCEECVGRFFPLPALRHRTYRNSLAATGAVVGMQMAHRILGTYRNKVDAYIVLSEFQKSIMVRAGLPENHIYVKPNFIPDPLSEITSLPERSNQVVFVGRIAHEKGVDLLLNAWRRIKPAHTRLVIIGEGPERVDLQRRFGDLDGVVWRGWLDREDTLREIAGSRYLVMPSRWFETFGIVLIEAFSLGTPVIAPNYGGFPEIVTPGSNGLLLSAGDENDLRKKLGQALQLEEALWQQWSTNARHAYVTRYTPAINYPQLISVYERAIEHAQIERA